MYNFALAFVICCVVYLIGEIVSNLTKAWVPSVFVTAAVLLVGYWCGLPKEVITDSKLLPFGKRSGEWGFGKYLEYENARIREAEENAENYGGKVADYL